MPTFASRPQTCARSRCQCKEYYDSAKTWRMINKRYPSSLEEMAGPLSPSDDEPFIRIELDPWVGEYVMRREGKKLRILSFGPDGQEGTDDDVMYPGRGLIGADSPQSRS